MGGLFRRICGILLLAALGAGALYPQGRLKPAPQLPPITIEPDDEQGRLGLAYRLMQADNYQGAAALLEGLYEADPHNASVQSILLVCYLQLGHYAKAEELAKRQVGQNPANFAHRLQLAEVLVRQGNQEEGLAVYDQASALIPDSDPARYLIVIRSMINHDLEERALELIDSARVKSADPQLYALERGSILERQKEYSLAAEEYLSLLAGDTAAQAVGAEKRLLALLDFPESSPEVEGQLLAWGEGFASVRTLRLLVSHYLKAGRTEEAFRFALQRDSLEGSQGQPLLDFVRQCQERKAYAQVIRMAEYILHRYPDLDKGADVSSRYARALTEVGRTADAIKVYDDVVARLPESQQAADALFDVGWLHYQYLNDCPTALLYFDSVLRHQPRGMSYLNAQRAIPYCFLRSGKLQKARETFGKLSRLNINDDIAEEVDYHLALVEFFQKRYDSAEVSLRKLMVDYPRGFYVNDALQLVLMITEADEAEELLHDYSDALLFELRLLYDSARVQLERIAAADNQGLADVALFRLSKLELNRQDTVAALVFIDRLCQEFPDSYYVPYGTKTKADILALDLDKQHEAGLLYKQLLESCPNCPFASEVRERLRELEADRGIG